MELTTQALHQHEYGDYDGFVQRLNDRFNAITGPVFETDATGLYAAYLASFTDPAARQYHTCSCCEAFIERFGSLATVDDDGHLVALWQAEDAPEHYQAGAAAMARLVRRAKITKPFLSEETMYGTPIKGVRESGALWRHFAIQPRADRVYRSNGITDAFQAASVKREEFNSVRQALGEYSSTTCATALQLLKSDQLGNSAAVMGQAQFMFELHAARSNSMNMDNTTWRMVATAPSGLCHPRTSMIATLLDDIAAGKSFEQAQRAWNAKMHPLQYQRPQAAPSAGNIAQAEKLFSQLGLAPALNRRIARLDEVPKLWEPQQQPAAPAGGVFGHLKPKVSTQTDSMITPPIAITLEKFSRTVVPTAEKIEVQLASRAHFITITTAADPESPKLFQWDHPFAWYLWHGGAAPSQYGLNTGWANVAAITRLPARWNDEGTQKFQHHGDSIILLLDGARETRAASAAIFPACLRAELREVRATIESYSNNAKMTGLADGSAIGIDMRQAGAAFPALVRVTAKGHTQTYKIDRWD